MAVRLGCARHSACALQEEARCFRARGLPRRSPREEARPSLDACHAAVDLALILDDECAWVEQQRVPRIDGHLECTQCRKGTAKAYIGLCGRSCWRVIDRPRGSLCRGAKLSLDVASL